MALANKASECRSRDNTLKNSSKMGDKDVEIYIKTKGSEEQFRKIPLKEFMGETELPEVDSKIKMDT